MKRTYERILFMIIGALIAFCAYMVGNIDSNITAEEFQDPNHGHVIGCDTLIVNKTLLVGNPEKGHVVMKANNDTISIQLKNRKDKDNFVNISVSNDDSNLELSEFTTGNRLLMVANKRTAMYSALDTHDYEKFHRIISMRIIDGNTGIRIEDDKGEKTISTTD